MRRLSLALFVLGCVLLFVRLACFSSVPGAPPLPPAVGPWAVNGIVLGATEAECRATLGEDCDERVLANGRRHLTWPRRGPYEITFGTDGRAVDVVGDMLTDRAGTIVVPSGATPEHVRQLLPDADEEEVTRPGGSGVITVSRKLVGRVFSFEDDRGVYSIGFDALGGLRHVRGLAHSEVR